MSTETNVEQATKVVADDNNSQRVYLIHSKPPKSKRHKRTWNGRRITVAGIVDEAAQTVRLGYAICNPVDNFCKECGIELATKRAGEDNAFTVGIPAAFQETPGKFFVQVGNMYANSKMFETENTFRHFSKKK